MRNLQQKRDDDLAERLARFAADGEAFTWRKCFACQRLTKNYRGQMGLLKKDAYQPDLSFLDSGLEAASAECF